MTNRPGEAASSAGILRRSLLLLAALGTAGTAVELALERHWDGVIQLIPWFAIALLVLAIVLLVRSPNRWRVVWARILGGFVVFIAFIGVAEHVISNHDSDPLDFRYATSWTSIGEVERWFLAVTDSVGPSPTLAPMALAFMSLAVVFATLGHPDG